MKNVQIADNQVERLRTLLIKADKDKEINITINDLLDTLTCLERLSVIERHLYNLVSEAYEEDVTEPDAK